jgi:hypothetical protein
MPETVSVQIDADAAACVEALGMRREMDQMIEHALQTAPGIRAIRVRLEYDPVCPENEPLVVIGVYREAPPGGADDVNWGWWRWRANTFPSEVCLNLKLWTEYGDPDGR